MYVLPKKHNIITYHRAVMYKLLFDGEGGSSDQLRYTSVFDDCDVVSARLLHTRKSVCNICLLLRNVVFNKVLLYLSVIELCKVTNARDYKKE